MQSIANRLQVGLTPTLASKHFRSVAQPGSAPGLGPGGPRFESLYSDQLKKRVVIDNPFFISQYL